MRCAGLVFVLALAGFGPLAVAAEVARVESVGAVAINAAQTGGPLPRDAALQRGLSEAVRRVAIDLLTAGAPPPLEGEELLPEDMAVEVLGQDPLVYVTRFRILEDRGERPALFVEDPEVQTEYVVVAEVNVDVERVRRRLAENGLLTLPSGDSPRVRLRVRVDGVESYGAHRAVEAALIEAAGAPVAMLVEVEHGVSVFEVETERHAPDLLNALMRLDRPGLRIAPIAAGETSLAVLVEWDPPPSPDSAADVQLDAGEAGEIDTPARKRY